MLFRDVLIAAKLIVRFTESVDPDKCQVCAVELVLPEYFVPSIKMLRECSV